jgi:ADP-ribose pyrophosphatase YjhB (NUDIX family)
LLALRRDPPNAGQWSLPGGAVELGESVIQAVQREVQEETGVVIDDVQLLDLADLIMRDGSGQVEYHYVVVYYLARPVGGTLLSGDDAVEARWVTPAEMLELGLTRPMTQVVRQGLAAAAARDRLVNGGKS